MRNSVRETELFNELIKLVPEAELKTLELGDISVDEYGRVKEKLYNRQEVEAEKNVEPNNLIKVFYKL